MLTVRFCSMRTVLFNVSVKMNCFVFLLNENKNCSVCNTKIDIDNYKKDITVCKDCYNKKKRKKNNLVQNEITISHQQPKTESGNNNNRTLLVGTSFPVKHILY